MSTTLQSYVSGRWTSAAGKPLVLVNPSTEETVATVNSGGWDAAEAVSFARRKGGPALRKMTFAARGKLLSALAQKINELREPLIELGIANAGNTRSDAKFDIDGASATLMFYAELGAALGERTHLADGEGMALGRSARLFGQHILVPRHGVAVHINAFNFPAWGMAEKMAVALLAGVPVMAKPATATAWMAHRMAQGWVEANILPEGVFSFIAGDIGSVLQHLDGQDVVAFTGSGHTATMIRRMENLVAHGVHVNVEADSLNAAILGEDLSDGSETLNVFLSDVSKEMTQKTGQKCTAIRRIYVPASRLEDIQSRLVDRLSELRVGNPSDPKVTLGPVATAQQLKDVLAGIQRLASRGKLVTGRSERIDGLSAPAGKGFFVSPALVVSTDPQPSDPVNTDEVFGPVATLMPYRSLDELEALVAAGKGGLVSAVYSDDASLAQNLVHRLAPFHGRMTITNEKLAGQSLPPGLVLPQLLHGGPGRAGGGEELGGLRGLSLYCQRVALQGPRAWLESWTTQDASSSPVRQERP